MASYECEIGTLKKIFTNKMGIRIRMGQNQLVRNEVKNVCREVYVTLQADLSIPLKVYSKRMSCRLVLKIIHSYREIRYYIDLSLADIRLKHPTERIPHGALYTMTMC
ncbi:hypothetical protein PIB30_045680 [Stylosanthes scabra]|uniref:Ribosomal protein S10 n=1 Tax=Stylosanthes scabra TaxID=79078 RepID=A0ABU6RG98_9FABA|nr:hypothetical protein [Stylosanthes scabra]